MSRGSRWGLLVVLYLVWLVVPAGVFGYAYSDGGGLDGPCLGTASWSMGFDEGTSMESHGQRWPPLSLHCTVTGATGVIAERTFPGPVTYAAVLALLVAPFAVWPLAKRMAREALFNRTPRPG